jgi:hypothetical protein
MEPLSNAKAAEVLVKQCLFQSPDTDMHYANMHNDTIVIKIKTHFKIMEIIFIGQVTISNGIVKLQSAYSYSIQIIYMYKGKRAKEEIENNKYSHPILIEHCATGRRAEPSYSCSAGWTLS